MSDSLGNGEGNPSDQQINLYEKWALGGTALSIIGEVQWDPRFPEKPGNLVLSQNTNLEVMKSLTARASIDGAHIWTQLGHAGALSFQPISGPAGPSPLNIEGLQCRGLTLSEIQQLPEKYAHAAVQAKEAGFTGIHIHAGHGFLLNQFLSPLLNHRTDGYDGSIGIRKNSKDKLEGGFTKHAQAVNAIKDGKADIIGLARTMVLNTRLAENWMSEEPNDPIFPRFKTNPPGGVTAWYSMRMTAIGENKENDFNPDLDVALKAYDDRDLQRVPLWLEKFASYYSPS